MSKNPTTNNQKKHYHKFCPNYAMPLRGESENKVLVARARCKQWSCPYCAGINRNIWIARICEHIKRTDYTWFFWTVTLSPRHHKNGTTESSLLVWRDKWNNLMSNLRNDSKKYVDKMHYVRIFETHKSGILHVHMIANWAYNDVKRIEEDDNTRFNSESFKKRLLQQGLGKIHDIRPCVRDDIGNYDELSGDDKMMITASYVSKYMTKDMQSDVRQKIKNAGLSRVRMIQTSHGWFKHGDDSDDEITWKTERTKLAEYLSDDRDYYDVQLKKTIEAIDFNNVLSIYPFDVD